VRILLQVEQMTREAGFVVGDSFDVMDGSMEGLYGWMSANRDVGLGKLGNIVLDLGGGSTQLAAEVSPDSEAQTQAVWFRGQVGTPVTPVRLALTWCGNHCFLPCVLCIQPSLTHYLPSDHLHSDHCHYSNSAPTEAPPYH